MRDPPAAPAPRATPAPAAGPIAAPSETVALEIGMLEATLPPLSPAGGAERTASTTPSTPAPAPGAEP